MACFLLFDIRLFISDLKLLLDKVFLKSELVKRLRLQSSSVRFESVRQVRTTSKFKWRCNIWRAEVDHKYAWNSHRRNALAPPYSHTNLYRLSLVTKE